MMFNSLHTDQLSRSALRLLAGILANMALVGLLIHSFNRPARNLENIKRVRWVSLLPPIAKPATPFQKSRPTLLPARRALKKFKPEPSKLIASIASIPIEPPVPIPSSAAPLPVIAAVPLINTPKPANKPVLGSFESPAPIASQRTAATPQMAGFAQTLSAKPMRNSRETQDSSFSANTFSPVEVSESKAKSRSSQLLLANAFDQQAPAKRETQSVQNQLTNANFKPVEILSKPTPQYTNQARQLAIEGEVSVRAMFRPDGKVMVLSIVDGLGYGLDENAALAVSQIQFKPATRLGQAIEQVAVVRVRFQLAQ